MKLARLVLLWLVLLAPSVADAWPRHGSGAAPTPPPLGAQKTVLNLNYGSDQYANLAKTMVPIPTANGNSISNFNADGYPHGVLVGNVPLSQTALPQNYFGHHTMQSVGNAGLNMFFVPPLIVYNGGNSVLSVSPANTGVSNTGGGGIGLLPNGNWNVEFSFGDLVTAVANNGSGLIRLTLSTNSATAGPYGTNAKVQIHNVSGISPTQVYSLTVISANTVDLQASTYVGGMTPAGGGPGTAAEMIVQVGSVTWSWWQSTTGFSNINHTITDWIFCKTSELASVQAGNVLSVEAINATVALSPAWLRNMDMIGVQAVSGQFKYNPSDTAQNFTSSQFYPNYYGGTTAGSGDNYTVAPGPLSPTSGPYEDGELIQFKADRSTVAKTPTLAINGRSTGALPLFTDQTTGTFVNLTGQPAGIAISSISGSGTLATVTTAANHGFTTGQRFVTNVGGNTPSGFNAGNALATATGLNTFTYSNATGGSTSVAGIFTPQVAEGDIINTTFNASYFAGSTYTHKYYVNLGSPSYTGTVSGKTLTVSAVASGTLVPGQRVTGSGLSNTPIILPYGTNSSTGTGNTGTYMLDIAPTGTTTLTGTTGQTGSGCSSGTVNSVSALSADMSCVMDSDVTLLAQGFQFGNNGGTGISVLAPRMNAPLTVSVSIAAAGGAAEVATVNQATLTSGNSYTAQYRPILGGWYLTGGTAISGVPMKLFKEYATRTGAGIWFNVPLSWSQKSAQDFGTYLAVNFPGRKVATELENELWNSGQNPDHVAQGFGVAMGFAAVQDGLYFHSVYSSAAWGYVNILKTIVDSYVAAGGTRSNMYSLIQNSGSDGQACRIIDLPCLGGQTGSLHVAWDGATLTPNAITFTGTIAPNANGTGGVLTISGGLTPPNAEIYPGFTLSGVGVTAGTKIGGGLPSNNFNVRNGTYILDTPYAVTIGPVTMTAINTTFAAHGGWAGAPTSTDHNAFPNRPIDYADAIGYANYYTGAIAQNGAGTWNGAQAPYNIFFQAAADYAQGVATSNPTLTNNGLNVWSADATTVELGKTANYNGNSVCGFISSSQTLGFCNNTLPATGMLAPAFNSDTMNVTVAPTGGTVQPGQRVSCGGCSATPVVLAYGTGGTTGTGGLGTYKLSTTINTVGQSITRIEKPTGQVQGWENITGSYDPQRIGAGMMKLGVIQYEASLQQNFCSGNPCPVGNISLNGDTPTLAGQFTSNGWANLDTTYGYPGFGTGNTQTAANVISLYLGYVNSQQYYNDSLFFYQKQALIHAARPYFGPAQYGIEGTVGAAATTGAPQWGMYPGDLSTPPLQNYFAQQYFNTH